MAKKKWKVKIKEQDDKVVHFHIFEGKKLYFTDPIFDKERLIDLIIEGNYDNIDASPIWLKKEISKKKLKRVV